jgi:hypothetical protein
MFKLNASHETLEGGKTNKFWKLVSSLVAKRMFL